MSVDQETPPQTPPGGRIRTMCATCVRGARSAAGRYRGFLLNPGAVVTVVALVLWTLRTERMFETIASSTDRNRAISEAQRERVFSC